MAYGIPRHITGRRWDIQTPPWIVVANNQAENGFRVVEAATVEWRAGIVGWWITYMPLVCDTDVPSIGFERSYPDEKSARVGMKERVARIAELKKNDQR